MITGISVEKNVVRISEDRYVELISTHGHYLQEVDKEVFWAYYHNKEATSDLYYEFTFARSAQAEIAYILLSRVFKH